VQELENKIATLKSGTSTQATDEAAKLEGERKKIQDELKTLLAKVKKQLGV